MRKIALLVISLVFLFLGLEVSAQATVLPNPGVTPDNPLYFFERISESIGTFFTFGDVKKAERYINLASERVAEAKAVSEKGNSKATQVALRLYEDELNKSLAREKKAKDKGEHIGKVAEIVAEATSKHFSVLERVLEKSPEQAKKGLTNALEKSKHGHITALKALAGENPSKAAEIDINSSKECLKRAKEASRDKNKERIKENLKDYEDFQSVLENIRGKNKDVAVLVSEAKIKDVEDLDKIEDEAESISDDARKNVKDVKDRAIERQMSSLKDVAKEDPEEATKINLKMVDSRINRVKTKAEENKKGDAEEATEEVDKQYKFGEEISQIAKGLGKDTTTVEELVEKATTHHLEVLSAVYQKVPDSAKPAIERAMVASAKGHQRATESLKEKGVLNKTSPEVTPNLKNVPEGIRERIQKKANEEVEKENLEKEKSEIKKPGVEQFKIEKR